MIGSLQSLDLIGWWNGMVESQIDVKRSQYCSVLVPGIG